MASEIIVPDIHFDPETHVYTVNGEEMPSVTTILADAGIIQKQKYPEGAANKGKDIHKLLQLADENDLDYASVTDDQFAHLERWSMAKGKIGFVSPRHELIVFNSVSKYAGTIDAVDDDRLVEIKSGRKERWHALQLTAYRMAYEFYLNVKVRVSYLVYTRPDTEDFVVEVEPSEYLEDVFLSAVNVSRWKHEKGHRKGGCADLDAE